MTTETALIFTGVGMTATILHLVWNLRRATARPAGTDVPQKSLELRSGATLAGVLLCIVVIGLASNKVIEGVSRENTSAVEARHDFERALGDVRKMFADVADIKSSTRISMRAAENDAATKCEVLRARQLSLQSDLAHLKARKINDVTQVSAIERELAGLQRDIEASKAYCLGLGKFSAFNLFGKRTTEQ